MYIFLLCLLIYYCFFLIYINLLSLYNKITLFFYIFNNFFDITNYRLFISLFYFISIFYKLHITYVFNDILNIIIIQKVYFTRFYLNLFLIYNCFFYLLRFFFNVYYGWFLKGFNIVTWLWFPWESFFSFLTILLLLYIIIFICIYSTENSYYIILYLIFFILLMSITLVYIDLDIFAALLVLIESVVVLMFFFLIIYLNSNIKVNNNSNKWKLYTLYAIFCFVISLFTYINVGAYFFLNFSVPSNIFDDYFESLYDIDINDLSGIFTNFYIINSIFIIIVAILLLIISMLCVLLTSFFIKARNLNLNVFLDIFNIMKTCYSFIFLRKQNLYKQGRSQSSSRVFNKKVFDSKLHKEYKEKQDIFEKKKQDEENKKKEDLLKEQLKKEQDKFKNE